MMQLTTIGIPATRRFCASKADLKRTFTDIEPLSAHMGSLQNKFQFDPRCPHRPKLRGQVIASVSVSRELTAILQLYPIAAEKYPAVAAEQFRDKILPRMRAWLISQLSRPQTAVLGYEEFIVEWTGSGHREHSFRFL
jgi:hypothetical protein